MIVFEKIRFRNLLSYGMNWTEVPLNSHNKILITGTNGSGKCLDPSTIVDVEFENEEIRKRYENFLKSME